jgi:hypothetical protein
LARSPDLVCRRDQFTERQIHFLFNLHTP